MILIFSLFLMGNGCASLKPSANLPESEQAAYDYRNRTDSATLQNEDAFWNFIAVLVRISLGQ
jgi:hypothetical protein